MEWRCLIVLGSENTVSVGFSKIWLDVYLHFISNWTDNCSELPTEFWAWHVYKPASRRPTGLSCNVSCARITITIKANRRIKNKRKQIETRESEWVSERNNVIVIISGDLLSKRSDKEHATSHVCGIKWQAHENHSSQKLNCQPKCASYSCSCIISMDIIELAVFQLSTLLLFPMKLNFWLFNGAQTMEFMVHR